MKTLKHDIAIIGGSMGGTAAAIVSAGHDVIFVAEHDWIGGQMTSQGVSAFDEHDYIFRIQNREKGMEKVEGEREKKRERKGNREVRSGNVGEIF